MEVYPCKSPIKIVYSCMKIIKYFHKGSCCWVAESERSSSDPMNLLVKTSVGMWFAEYINASNADNPYMSCIAFFVYMAPY